MRRRIHIDKAELYDLYEVQGLSTRAIAARYSCDHVTVSRRLKEHGIIARSAFQTQGPFSCDKPTLHALYIEQGLSSIEIGKRYGCDPKTIRRHLRQVGIRVRTLSESHWRIPLSAEQLRNLYVYQKLSAVQIAEKFNCDESSIRSQLQALGIGRRTRAGALLLRSGNASAYKDFDGSLVEKSYLIGFRIGDLTVRKEKPSSQQVLVEGCSTRPEQIGLIRQLFEPYGRITVKPYLNKHTNIVGERATCRLNASFEFLLVKPDHIPQWILKDDSCFAAFFAGLVDAEGSFALGKTGSKRAFSISMIAKPILEECRARLTNLSVRCQVLSLARRAGSVRPNQIIARNDLWSFAIGSKDGVGRLIALIEPYIKHPKRRADMLRVRDSIEQHRRV